EMDHGKCRVGDRPGKVTLVSNQGVGWTTPAGKAREPHLLPRRSFDFDGSQLDFRKRPQRIPCRYIMSKSIQCAVVGSGYVGLVAAVCFAEIGHNVVCVDNDERKVAALESGDTLIHEKHLPELLLRYRNTKIHFTTDLSEATRDCEAIFIAVGTPQSESGDADLSYVEAVACEIARSINSYKVIVEKSTVPVYTNEWIRRAIERNGVGRGLFDVVSNPEFLREGTAVQDFLHPDRI